jgi:hypothetical protein
MGKAQVKNNAKVNIKAKINVIVNARHQHFDIANLIQHN